jgi:zinc transport system substrate-binding protein
LRTSLGGEQVTVQNLTQPGAEPHDLELRPKQIAAVADADVAGYEKGFQPAVDQTIEQLAGGRGESQKRPAFETALCPPPL